MKQPAPNPPPATGRRVVSWNPSLVSCNPSLLGIVLALLASLLGPCTSALLWADTAVPTAVPYVESAVEEPTVEEPFAARPLADGRSESWPAATWARELGPPMPLAAAGTGSLMLRTSAPGLYLASPTLTTEVSYRVTGFLARARVTQRFRNPTPQWVEGVYVFPLPENAAVDSLRMRVGDREIEGEIQEREAAQRTFAQARSEGKKASLVEQERPNLFTTSVTNLGPGEAVEVVIEFQQELRYDQGTFELRFPMVAGPRYIPGGVEDAARISPPVLHPSSAEAGPPGASGPRHPVLLTVDLDPGFPLARLESPSHTLGIQHLGAGRQRVAMQPVAADRDFVLVWEPRAGRAPQAALFTQSAGSEAFALLMVLPPLPRQPRSEDLPREVVFVLDTSGSMGGASIRQAKSALLLALETLDPRDHFNVIEFNSYTRKLYPGSVVASPEALDEARRWVRRLRADGGTEILSALITALENPLTAQATPGSWSSGVRQVIFITDASVGNEAQLFHAIDEHLGASRLFTVGIGTAPNSHFLTRAAEIGRGTYTFIATPEEVEERMVGLFAKLESPVLSGIEVLWDDPSPEMWPSAVRDLYLGEPVVAVARLSRGELAAGRQVTVAGHGPEGPWERRFDLGRATREATMAGDGASSVGLDRLWARRKIASLMTELALGGDPTRLREQVVEVALDHHLVSQFTSLVAVDTFATAPAGTVAEVRPIPVLLPAGWSWPGVFGNAGGPGVLPMGATGARRDLWVALALALLAVALRLLGGQPRRRGAASGARR